MIFLDANIFLRVLTRSTDPAIQRMNALAGDLLRQADRGQIEVTTSDAVIAEVAFILTSKAHYQLAVDEAAGRLGAILRIRGFKLRDKGIMLGALDLWASHPKLGFVDALTASCAQQPDIELATFDSDFDDLPDIVRWHPVTECLPPVVANLARLQADAGRPDDQAHHDHRPILMATATLRIGTVRSKPGTRNKPTGTNGSARTTLPA